MTILDFKKAKEINSYLKLEIWYCIGYEEGVGEEETFFSLLS